MKTTRLNLLVIIMSMAVTAFAQEEHYVETRVSKEDTMAMVTLNEVNITSKRIFPNAYEEAKFNKLKRKVISVYPYAVVAKKIYFGLEEDMDTIKRKRKQKKHVKSTEKDLREKFEEDLKDLTRSEGRILVKLINRETGNNCYDLIKELKSGFSAFFWQNFGKFYGYDLKEEYDPEGVDADIEFIVQSIEAGFISLNVDDLESR